MKNAADRLWSGGLATGAVATVLIFVLTATLDSAQPVPGSLELITVSAAPWFRIAPRPLADENAIVAED